MFSAISILTLEQLRVQFSTSIIMQWTSLAGGLFLLPLVFFTENRILPTSNAGWLAVVGLGLISQAVGQGLLTYSLAKFSLSFVAVSMLAISVIALDISIFIRIGNFHQFAFASIKALQGKSADRSYLELYCYRYFIQKCDLFH